MTLNCLPGPTERMARASATRVWAMSRSGRLVGPADGVGARERGMDLVGVAAKADADDVAVTEPTGVRHAVDHGVVDGRADDPVNPL
jgi:hypothetical protein